MIKSLISESLKLGVTPRQVQKDALKWLESVWDSPNQCKILSMAVGAGKSLVAKSISAFNESKGLKTAIITPQNILIDQYTRDFIDINFLKGRQHYHCSTVKDSCEVGMDFAKTMNKSCLNCPYNKAKAACYNTNTTIFNPISYFLLQKETHSTVGLDIKYAVDTIIVDEVQALSGFLRDLSTVKIWGHDLQWLPGVTASIPNTIKLLEAYMAKLQAYIIHPNLSLKDKIRLIQSQRKLDFVLYHLLHESKYFICEESVEKFKGIMTPCLLIRPKYVPPSIYKEFFKIAKHVIFMSGTALQFMWEELGFTDVDYLDLPSPIAKERRLIFAPASITLSARQTDKLKRWETMQELAQQIKNISFNVHKNENGVVLLPYNLAKELKPLLTESCFIHMDKSTKKARIDQFMKGSIYGVGVFSGAYEGISLDNHLSRFTIIPKVPYPNLMDKVVSARLADNNLTYALETMTMIIQASGRSVRSEKDYGACYILDSNFLRLYATTRFKLPNYFKESLVFSFPTENHIKQFEQYRKDYENDCSTRG